MPSPYTLGVDPAKRKLTAALLAPDGRVLLRPADFDASRQGFDALLACLQGHVPAGACLRVGTEATASLDDNFLGWLSHLQGRFAVLSHRLDPGQVARFSGARPIRGKTDSADALRIARFTAAYGGELPVHAPGPRELAMGRLVNERQRLVGERTAARNRLHDRVTISFPELYEVFTGPCLQTAMCLLDLCPTARDVARRHADTLARLQPAPRAARLGAEKAARLVALAKTSVASATEPTDGEAIRFLIAQLRAIGGRLERIDAALRQWADEAASKPGEPSPLPAQIGLLQTIPGIGFQGAATVVLRCGGILKYASPRALAAQLGACPDRHQTGASAGKGRLTHRGDRRTRPAMYLMALMATLADPAFAFLKWRHLRSGQRPKQAVCAVMNKLAAIIWAVVHRNGPYDPARMLRNIREHHREQWRQFLEQLPDDCRLRRKIPQWAVEDA